MIEETTISLFDWSKPNFAAWWHPTKEPLVFSSTANRNRKTDYHDRQFYLYPERFCVSKGLIKDTVERLLKHARHDHEDDENTIKLCGMERYTVDSLCKMIDYIEVDGILCKDIANDAMIDRECIHDFKISVSNHIKALALKDGWVAITSRTEGEKKNILLRGWDKRMLKVCVREIVNWDDSIDMVVQEEKFCFLHSDCCDVFVKTQRNHEIQNLDTRTAKESY